MRDGVVAREAAGLLPATIEHVTLYQSTKLPH